MFTIYVLNLKTNKQFKKIKATITNNKIIGLDVMKFKILPAEVMNHWRTSVAIDNIPVIDDAAAFPSIVILLSSTRRLYKKSKLYKG